MKRTQFPNQKVRKNNEIKQKEAQKKKIKVEIYEAEKKTVYLIDKSRAWLLKILYR